MKLPPPPARHSRLVEDDAPEGGDRAALAVALDMLEVVLEVEVRKGAAATPLVAQPLAPARSVARSRAAVAATAAAEGILSVAEEAE